MTSCFNPLHCGAVVASRRPKPPRPRSRRVSIPFIAGQWSLRVEGNVERFLVRGFQSPSLRGSGRFTPTKTPEATVTPSFNPLHCGAVVASRRVGGASRRRRRVSIPFIAGQWSLRGVRAVPMDKKPKFQSPSLRGSGRFVARLRNILKEDPGFNPLHCGAVVASCSSAPPPPKAGGFQSPSLRGSGRFGACAARGRIAQGGSFNPLHCGAVVASQTDRPPPFGGGGGFQSPSLRGSGRFGSDRR